MIEVMLSAALSPLVGDRVFTDAAPYGTATPYITYQQVGGRGVSFLDGTAADLRNARIQVNVWSAKRLEANQIALQVQGALRAAAGLQVQPLGEFSARHEPELKLYGTQQDFDCWGAR